MEEIKEFFQELIADGFAAIHHSMIDVEDGLEIEIASQPNLGAYVFIPPRSWNEYPYHFYP